MSGSRTTLLYGTLVIHLFCNVLLIQSAISQGGSPVYVNPNDPIKAAHPTAAATVIEEEKKVVIKTVQPEYVTQTVYGFLDFTTTIGSTIMVFSPQSAAPEPVPVSVAPPVPKPSSVVNVVTVESTIQPVVPAETIKTTIQPTKSSKVITTAVPATFPSVVLPGDDPLDVEHAVITDEPVNVVSVAEEGQRSEDVDAEEEEEEEEENHDDEEHYAEDEPIDDNNGEDEEEDHHEIPQIQSSIVEVLSSESSIDPVLPVANHLVEPEYDFLSRQPSEYVEESYRVVNLKPPGKVAAKPKQRPVQPTQRKDDSHPTGLVTKLGGTVVKDGATTVHETSVIGTYINGKYAQVLQSTSQVIANKPKITPTSSLRILKTAAPAIPKNRFNVDPTPSFLEESQGHENLRAKKAPAQNLGLPSKNNRFRSRNSKESYDYADEDYRSTESKKSRAGRPAKKRYNRPNKESELATVSVFTETATPAYTNRRNKNPSRYNDNTNNNHNSNNRAAAAAEQAAINQKNEYSRRNFKPKIQPTTPLDAEQHQTTSLYKFKLNRTPGRWQYKTTPKPRVTIRKSGSNEPQGETKLPVINERPDDDHDDYQVEDIDLSSSPSINGDVLNDDGNRIDKPPPIETLKVEISTPADFSDTYYEIATIKSPYTFQVGTVRNTRFITVTSTFQKVLEPEAPTSAISGPLTENILATTSHIDKEQNLLETTIATLPPLYLASNVETPPLETLTETFSTSHVVLKTHILPVILQDSNVTFSHTLIQTYQVTRLVTAIKTLPPADLYQFVPSKRLNEFNSRLDEAGSELHLELEFGDNNEEDDDEDESAPRRELPPDLDLSNIGSEFDLEGVDKRKFPTARKPKPTPPPTTPSPVPPTPALSPELQQQLALLRLLNPQAQIPQVVSKPVIKTDTIYDSHVIPIFNGQSTIFSTISRPVSTVTRTEYELETSALPLPPIQPLNPLFQQQQQLQQLQQQQQQQQLQIQSTPFVTNAMVTQTNSKVLKLTFGAKTAYTTLFSTQVVPTLLTTYITNSVPVQATAAAFPGYFPAPYGFPYVG